MLTRTNAQLAVVQAALDKARVPNLIAGADLGPAVGPARRRGKAGADVDDARSAPRGPEDEPGPRGPHHVPPRQGPAVAHGDRPGLGAGLMPIASAQTPAAVDEERRLLYVALTRSEEELWCSWYEDAGWAPGRPGSQPLAGGD